MRIKEEEEINTITLTAHHISKNHTAAGIYSGVEAVIDKRGLWLERLETSITKSHPNFEHNIPLPGELHLRKLRGKFVSLDTCDTATLLGKNLCKRIGKVAEEKQLVPLMIEGVIIKTKVELC